ncbi:MAG: UDP-N-acetylglucosamine 2-epimerase, partial [Xanthomonadales bacterium]|nr:UDP-N-acetylglucosamine 2-epimerase [Xanthomonadales bacterium]
RDNTERPITCSEGTNVLIGRDPDRLEAEFRRALNADPTQARVPELWDGRAAERIVAVLAGERAQ